MKSLSILQFAMLLMVGLFIFACGGDDDADVDPCDSITATYNGNVKAIIDASCAYSGCHDGSTPNLPAGAEDYTTFAGLSDNISNENFKTRVIDALSMPPDVVPMDRPASLTDEQLQILQCWHNAGYPEG